MRTLAVVFMATSHITRLVKSSARDWWCAPSLLVDPLTQGLFLGLVGASLAWSWDNAQRRGTARAAWLKARAGRAFELYLVGVLLFLFDKGAQLPWLFTAPGILADIAVAIVLYAFVASSRRPVLGATALALLGYGALALLDAQGAVVLIPPLNGANAPLLPNIAVTGFGLVAGVGLVRGDRRLLAGLAAVGLVGGGWLLSQHSVPALLGDELGRTWSTIEYRGRSHGMANTWGMLTGVDLPLKETEYFNPSLQAQPFILGMLVAIYLGFRLLRPLLERVADTLLLPGRYALGAYVFHLVLVGLPVAISGRSKPLREEAVANAYMLFVLVAVYGYAFFREWQTRRRRARRAAAA